MLLLLALLGNASLTLGMENSDTFPCLELQDQGDVKSEKKDNLVEESDDKIPGEPYILDLLSAVAPEKLAAVFQTNPVHHPEISYPPPELN